MSDPAKKVLDLKRRVQQAFLAIKENCNPITFISRRKAGNAAEFQLKRTIEELTKEVDEIKAIKVEDSQQEMFLAEINLLEQSTARLHAIFHLMIVTQTLENMHGEEALLLIKKSEAEFNEMREKYPFIKKDVEADIAHTIYCLFIGIATEKEPLMEPKLDETIIPLVRQFKPISKCSQRCFDLLKKVRMAIDEPNVSLRQEGQIEQQEMFSTEKSIGDIKKSAKACDWLSALKLEKCKISNRAFKVLQCLKELLQLAATNQTDLEISRTIGSILQLYTLRASSAQHCGADSAVYFNDCFYLIIEMERAKFELIYKLETSTDAFNFSDLFLKLRLNARNVLVRDLVHIKKEFLTWPSDTFTTFLERKGNQITPVLLQLNRFTILWRDVCSKSVYAWLMIIACAHVLAMLVDSLSNLPDFERLTCTKILPVVKEVVGACFERIKESEEIMGKKLSELKFGQDLKQKVDTLKQTMHKQGADSSLTELFDFKVES